MIMPTEDIPLCISSCRDGHKPWHVANLTHKHTVPDKEDST